jgi:hypothetical protein
MFRERTLTVKDKSRIFNQKTINFLQKFNSLFANYLHQKFRALKISTANPRNYFSIITSDKCLKKNGRYTLCKYEIGNFMFVCVVLFILQGKKRIKN